VRSRPVSAPRNASSEGAKRSRALGADPSDDLTLPDRSDALPDNVRELLDWLVDEELKRWQRETR